MKAFMIIIVIIITAIVINWVRCGDGFALPEALPFMGGKDPGIYDLGACALLMLCLWGIVRLFRRGTDEQGSDSGVTSDYPTVTDNEDDFREGDDEN